MLSSLEISLWPEYDRPEMLVIYRGILAADTVLPVPVELRIPASAGQPSAMAYVGEGGQRFNQQYTTRVEGEWLIVSFELTTLGFQLEYYDALTIDAAAGSAAGQREYLFTYPADYATASLALDFQVPPAAESFTLDPPADSVLTEGDGLVYHGVQVGAVNQGETMDWTLSYQKADATLTGSALAAAVPPAAAPAPAAGGDNSTVVVFFVAFVALVAVAGGAFWLGQRIQPGAEAALAPSRQSKRRGSGRGSRSSGQQPARQDAGRERTRKDTDGARSPGVLYCYKCGVELRADSDFCHKCGAEVRQE